MKALFFMIRLMTAPAFVPVFLVFGIMHNAPEQTATLIKEWFSFQGPQ